MRDTISIIKVAIMPASSSYSKAKVGKDQAESFIGLVIAAAHLALDGCTYLSAVKRNAYC